MSRTGKNVRTLMTSETIRGAVARMAREIERANRACGTGLVLVGIQTGGVRLAHCLAEHLKRAWGHPVPVGQLDITMHRDDLDQHLAPTVHPTSIDFDITGVTVVLVDDVLFSGRTTRAALDAMTDLGRPSRVQLAVLVDRGHRELPIAADFVGKTVRTELDDQVEVRLPEKGAGARVILHRHKGKASSPS